MNFTSDLVEFGESGATLNIQTSLILLSELLLQVNSSEAENHTGEVQIHTLNTYTQLGFHAAGRVSAAACNEQDCRKNQICEFVGSGTYSCTCAPGFYGDNCDGTDPTPPCSAGVVMLITVIITPDTSLDVGNNSFTAGFISLATRGSSWSRLDQVAPAARFHAACLDVSSAKHVQCYHPI